MMPADTEALVDAIITLATEIAREAPDCADKALAIARLAGEIGPLRPDRGSIADALGAEGTSGDDLSDVGERAAAEAVARAIRP